MKVLAFAIVFLLSFAGLSQTSEFKKIVAEKDLLDRESYFKKLLEFQEINAQFAGVYYQLANVEMEIFSSLDPITERIESRQRILNIRTKYSLAKNYLDPKEIGRFPEWYNLPDMKDKDSLISLGLSKLDEAYLDSEKYTDEYENLIRNYDNAVSYYLKAREEFIQINNSAENLRQLFLQADDSLKQQVKRVGNNFDSCIYHLNIYRDTYQLLPHKEKRKVHVRLRRIDHFRMNGITPVNFLADDIDLWDYGTWSSRFLNLLKVEVDGLQDEIISAFDQFSSTNSAMISGEDCLQAEPDNLKFQRIINLISKYDNKSVLADIFRYLIAKLEYGNQYVYERNCNSYGAGITDDLVSRKARVYQSLFQKLRVADSLNEVIISSGNSEATFMWFFDKMMDGENGSIRFAESQKEENANSFKLEIQQLITNIQNQHFQADTLLSECFQVQDQMLVLSPDSTIDQICIQKKLAINDSLTLLMATQNEKTLLIGATPIALDFQKQWEIAPAKSRKIDYFKIVGDSSFVIGGYSGKAWVGYYSNAGRAYMSVALDQHDTIVNVSTNQLVGTMQVVQVSGGNHTTTTFNFGGKKTKKLNVKVDGHYVGSLSQDESTLIYTMGNEPNKLNCIEVDTEGEVVNQSTYSFDSNLKDPFIIKNNNQLITVVAKSTLAEDEIIYALLNYNGEVKHEKIF